MGTQEHRRAERFAEAGTSIATNALLDAVRLIMGQFSCCGYYDANTPPFVTDSTCPNVLAAARIGPCVGPFSAFANNLLDIIFTTLFGFVAVDVLLFLSTIVMIKSREKKERYRLIDEKTGGGF